MKFISVLLLAEAALGAHLIQHRRERNTKRAYPQANWNTNEAQTESSPNWAGGIITSTNITSVSTTITVPSVTVPSNSNSSDSKYCVAVWAGIDGWECSDAILQAGVEICIENGRLSYSAWYEWWPDWWHDLELEISEGDIIEITITATSATSGTAVLENHTTNRSVTKNFANEESSLCLVNAEWIVEDYEDSQTGNLVPLADYNDFTFIKAKATADGQTFGPLDGVIVNMEQDNTVLSSCSNTANTITCSYL